MDVKKIRKDFPILEKKFNGKKLVYLDSAATTQKPVQVIRAITEYYENYNANVHRGLNFLSHAATDAYEEAHEKTADFLNANSMEEIVFTKNATESLNLVAHSLGSTLKEGDEVLLSTMEHHANIVPWQELAKRKKIKVKYANVKGGRIDVQDLQEKITPKTKIVSITHASNILGTITPIREIGKMAGDAGAYFCVDAAQSAPHTKVDVKKINADFLAFSAHKMLGPTGIGILYGKKELFEKMPPFLTGGDMISTVTTKESTWNKLPWKFEAGTPNISGAIGFGAALDYLKKIGMDEIERHEKRLLARGIKKLGNIANVELYGPNKGERTGIISFNIKNMHPHDVAQILDDNAIAIRAGNHCAQPLMREMGIEGVARASFYIYNTEQEIDALAESIGGAKKIFGA